MSDEHIHDHTDEPPEGCEPESDPGWIAATDDFKLLSVNIHLRSCDEDFSAALRWILEPFRHARHEAGAFTVDMYRLDASGPEEPPGEPWYAWELTGSEPREGPLADVLNHAAWHAHALVPKHAGDYLFLHAGAVVHGGRGLLLPATRDTGKSTTVAALLSAGFDYLSDELGAIDPITGNAYPFPKRISLDDASLEFFPGLAGRLEDREGLRAGLYQRYVRPEDLGARAAVAAPVGEIVFLSPDHGGPPRLEPVPRSEAVREMAANCFNLYRYEGRGVVLLSRVAADARTYRLTGGTPHERAAALAELVASRP